MEVNGIERHIRRPRVFNAGYVVNVRVAPMQLSGSYFTHAIANALLVKPMRSAISYRGKTGSKAELPTLRVYETVIGITACRPHLMSGGSRATIPAGSLLPPHPN